MRRKTFTMAACMNCACRHCSFTATGMRAPSRASLTRCAVNCPMHRWRSSAMLAIRRTANPQSPPKSIALPTNLCARQRGETGDSTSFFGPANGDIGIVIWNTTFLVADAARQQRVAFRPVSLHIARRDLRDATAGSHPYGLTLHADLVAVGDLESRGVRVLHQHYIWI